MTYFGDNQNVYNRLSTTRSTPRLPPTAHSEVHGISPSPARRGKGGLSPNSKVAGPLLRPCSARSPMEGPPRWGQEQERTGTAQTRRKSLLYGSALDLRGGVASTPSRNRCSGHSLTQHLGQIWHTGSGSFVQSCCPKHNCRPVILLLRVWENRVRGRRVPPKREPPPRYGLPTAR